MNKDEIKELSEKILSGTASDEEYQLYNRLLSFYSTEESEWNEEMYGNKDELQKTIKKVIWKNAGIERPVVKMQWLKWAAAAIFILMTASVSYFITIKNTQKPPVAVILPQTKQLKHDIAPGQVGAVLTLASGKKILLDSISNGSLARQGNVSVIKNNGELVYNTNEATGELAYNTMTTPKGRQFNLVLADGSKVWLNAASSITFPTAFTGKERKVSITGEAYFEIAHNTSMPFIVENGTTSVVVLGTHFNVNAYDDESVTTVTLLEGRVNIKSGDYNTGIKPGQQVQTKQDGKITVLNNVDIDNVMAWKNGRIKFYAADIEAVMRQISRWYDVDIVYDKKLDDLFYAEIPRTTMLSDVLKALEITKKVKFRIEGRKVFVMP